MEIDLIKLIKLELNINEYLTLLKLDKNSKGIDFPFTSTQKHLDRLAEKKYIIISGNYVTLTNAGNEIVSPTIPINFDEIFDMYPQSTPNGRKLRAKSKTIGGRLTKDYTFLRDKYQMRIKSPKMHQQIVIATQSMLKERDKQGSLEYLKQLQFYITSQGWEQYMDEDGNVEDVSNAIHNTEKL